MNIHLLKGKPRGRPIQDSSHLSDKDWRKTSRRRLNAAIFYRDFPKASTKRCFICDKQADAYHHNRAFPLVDGFNAAPICNACLEKTMYEIHPWRKWDSKKQKWQKD